MANLPALRVAVAETVPYCGQGETVPNAWARRERAERILLDAVPALLDELEAARAVLETSEIAWFFAKWPASKKSDQVAMLVDRAAWQAWQARAGKEQA